MEQDILKNINISEEEILQKLDPDNKSHLIMTDKFIYFVQLKYKEPQISCIKISSLDGYDLSLQPKNPSQFYWSVLGIICAVGFWQLSSDKLISVIGGIFITLISILLAVDYWFSPTKFMFKLFSGTDIISAKIEKENLDNCRKFLAKINETGLT